MIATDASADQIAHALAAPNVAYRVAVAESSGLADGAAGMVTVAQALHWLDLEAFYSEVRRVAAPGGCIAAWAYTSCDAGGDVAGLVHEFEHVTVGPYWNPGRRWVDEHYRTIPFPFAELPAPAFELHKRWTLGQFGGYLGSWSAVAKYRDDRGKDPVAPLLERLAHHWRSTETRDVRWPICTRVGRIG